MGSPTGGAGRAVAPVTSATDQGTVTFWPGTTV
jgi:hypothetical protein